MTIKNPPVLTDCEGDTLRIYPWRSGRVTLVARQGDKRAEVGPFDPTDLIAAIREAARKTGCDAVSYNHVRVTSEDVTALLDALDAAEAELATERQAASAAREVMDRHRCDEQAERAYRRAERAEAAVQRLRDLHAPRVEEATVGACADEECDHYGPCPGSPFTVCAECWRVAEETYRYFGEDGIAPVLYPCPTLRALDGDA